MPGQIVSGLLQRLELVGELMSRSVETARRPASEVGRDEIAQRPFLGELEVSGASGSSPMPAGLGAAGRCCLPPKAGVISTLTGGRPGGPSACLIARSAAAPPRRMLGRSAPARPAAAVRVQLGFHRGTTHGRGGREPCQHESCSRSQALACRREWPTAGRPGPVPSGALVDAAARRHRGAGPGRTQPLVPPAPVPDAHSCLSSHGHAHRPCAATPNAVARYPDRPSSPVTLPFSRSSASKNLAFSASKSTILAIPKSEVLRGSIEPRSAAGAIFSYRISSPGSSR